MIAIKGLVDVIFIPTIIAMLAGICCLFTSSNRKESNKSVIFVALIFVSMLFWRMPIVISERYMFPVIIPAIILAAYFFKNLSDSQNKYCRYICSVLLLVCMIISACKAMRFQEAKPYLREIPDFIIADTQKNHWGNAYILILGNNGGEFIFDNDFILNETHGGKYYSIHDRQEIFKKIDSLSISHLILHYPVLYIIVVSKDTGDVFKKTWQEKYNVSPELVYEYTNKKNETRNQVFRIVSGADYQQKIDLYKTYNLLPNPEFFEKNTISKNASNSLFSDKNIKIISKENSLTLPVGWHFSMYSNGSSRIAGFEYTEQNRFRFYSDVSVYMNQVSSIAGGKKYFLYGKYYAWRRSFIRVNAHLYQQNKRKSNLQIVSFDEMPGAKVFFVPLDISNWDGEAKLEIILHRGDIELYNLYLVEQSVFAGIKE